MSFRCDACSKTDIANDGALKRHFRACPAYNEQFSQLRTAGAKRKLDAAGLNVATKSQPFKKRSYRPPLAAKPRMVNNTTSREHSQVVPANMQLNAVSVLDDILDDPVVQADDEGFEADDEATSAQEIDPAAPQPTNADDVPGDNANLHPPERAVPASRGEDRRRRPYQDVHPVGPGRLLPVIQGSAQAPPGSSRGIFTFTFRIPPAVTSTAINAFGIYREYRGVITELPDKIRRIGFFTTRSTQLKPKPPYQPPDNPKVYGPCKNPSIFTLQYWHWVLPGEGRTCDLHACMADMTDMPWYNSSTIKQTNLANVDDELTSPLPPLNNDNEAPWEKTGWTHHTVKIAIPLPNMKDSYDPYAPGPSADSSQNNVFSVPGLYLRSLSSLIRDELTKPATCWFHWRPFSQFWKPDSAPAQRIYDELYSSPIWLEADRKVQELDIPGCTLPRAIAGLMFWSDSTCVSEFGTKSLWPIYLYFGNQSKYERSRPSKNAGHQVAFLPTIPDKIMDFICSIMGTTPPKELLTFCKRELMHGAWHLLLDDDFKKGWKQGWVIKCVDGVTRRIFPRIFTYSADYPEKALLATIRDKGGCPCPRCLVKMKDTSNTGTPQDMRNRATRTRQDSHHIRDLVRQARDKMFHLGHALTSAVVENLLKPLSLVPVVNAFSELLVSVGMNYYDLFVIDFLHEFELGVWKAVLTHLIRMLHACGEDKIQAFNHRMRETPLFGYDTIRKFANNVSEMKKMAARDYEDILQTIIPAIEDLIDPPHNTVVLEVLYLLLEYHACAKLRMHTDSSLKHWDEVTIALTDALRSFQQSTSSLRTVETPRERAARAQRAQERVSQSRRTNADRLSDVRVLNLSTYKFHALGDGPSTVRRFGTTDSYTTQVGERQHRVPKAMYKRTSKNRDATGQVTRQDQRKRNLIEIAARVPRLLPPSFKKQACGRHQGISFLSEQDLLQHHIIAKDTKKFINLSTWLNDPERVQDPAYRNFRKNLQSHLVSRIKKEKLDEDFPEFPQSELDKVTFHNGRLYPHVRMRVLYTTYDLRRAVDILDTENRPNVMAPAYYDGSTVDRHPFWYARILGIYHADVNFGLRNIGHMEFLWVRWYAWDETQPSGWANKHLDRLAYDEENYQFGFLDPAAVIRAAHLIPVWAKGRTQDYYPESKMTDSKGDWKYHYVNRFADRDMYMRYHGGGVGHCRTMGASAPVSVPDPTAQPLAQAEREHGGEEVLEDTGDIPNATEDESNSDTSEPSESDSNGSLFEDDNEGMDSCDAE